MAEFEPSDINKYKDFKDFFARKHKSGSRPIVDPENARRAVVVADSRMVVYESVPESKKLWIKGNDFRITNLVMVTRLGAQFHSGAVASFRLSPQDYHSPVSGRIREFRSIPGNYYQVDAIALRSKVDILTRNARSYVVIETSDFGKVLFVAIWATDVGTVNIHEKFQQSGHEIEKGEERGIFQFGASSIIVAFGRIRFDEDIVKLSKQCIQVTVEVGTRLGEAQGEHS
jgi:phosphatidylserine decarboxylase